MEGKPKKTQKTLNIKKTYEVQGYRKNIVTKIKCFETENICSSWGQKKMYANQDRENEDGVF